MHALRFPLAAGLGLFVALAVFTLLWTFVSRPMDFKPASKARDVHFTTKIVEPNIEPKRQPKVIRRPPPVVFVGSLVRDHVTDVTPVRYEPATVGKFQPVTVNVDIGRRGPPQMGQDRDVIPLVRIPPEYPPHSGNTEGWVKVQFSITETGSVRDAFVVDAKPTGVFDAAALKAVARWRYSPKIEGGVAVERVGVQTIIRFELQ